MSDQDQEAGPVRTLGRWWQWRPTVRSVLLGGLLLCTLFTFAVAAYPTVWPWAFVLLGGVIVILACIWLKLRQKSMSLVLAGGLLGSLAALLVAVPWFTLFVLVDPITRANAQRIIPGMTARQVEAMLGPPDGLMGSEVIFVEARWRGGDIEISVLFEVTPDTNVMVAHQLEGPWKVRLVSWGPQPHLPWKDRMHCRLNAWSDRYLPAHDLYDTIVIPAPTSP